MFIVRCNAGTRDGYMHGSGDVRIIRAASGRRHAGVRGSRGGGGLEGYVSYGTALKLRGGGAAKAWYGCGD